MDKKTKNIKKNTFMFLIKPIVDLTTIYLK